MTTARHTCDLDLASRASRGGAEAWDELIARYGERIYNLTLRFAKNPTDAEDLTQEVFLRLYRNLHRYRGDVPLVAWALRLSRNLCIDHYRSARARHLDDTVSDTLLEHLPAADDPQARARAREELRHVEAVVRTLSETLATVLVLADFQGWSYEEIATFLDVPKGTVKSRLNRARHELTSRLEERLAPAVESGSGEFAAQGVPPC